MKNLLGKFHAELSQQRLARERERERERCPFLVFCQENFMKNLLGKFHAVYFFFHEDDLKKHIRARAHTRLLWKNKK